MDALSIISCREEQDKRINSEFFNQLRTGCFVPRLKSSRFKPLLIDKLISPQLASLKHSAKSINRRGFHQDLLADCSKSILSQLIYEESELMRLSCREERSSMRKAPVVFLITFIVFFAGMLYLSEIYPSLSAKRSNNLRIGMVLFGEHDGGGLSEAHYEAVLEVAREKGLVLEFFENISADEKCEEKIEELVKDGCGMIILDSGQFSGYSKQAALHHPDIYFLNAYGRDHLDNLTVYSSRMYQAAYLSGVVAGLQTEKDRIGYVAGFPTSYFKSDVNAFTMGVRKYNKDAEVFVRFAGSTGDMEAARQLIKDHDIDILECNTYSDRSLISAEEAGIWSIGCHHNNQNQYPKSYLTSALSNWKGFYKDQTERVINGTFRGSSFLLGIESRTVGLSSLTDNVKEGIDEKVSEEEDALLSLKSDVFFGPLYDSDGNLRVGEMESMPDKDIYDNFDWYVPGVQIDG